MMVFGMTLAVEMKINPAMLAAIIFLGAAGGGMSPLAATGIIGLNLCEEFGLTGIEAPLLVNGVFHPPCMPLSFTSLSAGIN